MDQILLLCTYRNTMGMPHQEISFDYIRLRHKSSVRLLLTTDASILTVSVTSLIRTLYFSLPVRFLIILNGVLEIMNAKNSQILLGTGKSLQLFKTQQCKSQTFLFTLDMHDMFTHSSS